MKGGGWDKTAPRAVWIVFIAINMSRWVSNPTVLTTPPTPSVAKWNSSLRRSSRHAENFSFRCLLSTRVVRDNEVDGDHARMRSPPSSDHCRSHHAQPPNQTRQRTTRYAAAPTFLAQKRKCCDPPPIPASDPEDGDEHDCGDPALE